LASGWFWLYYNPKNLFGFGKHEGDWEMIQIGLDQRGAPEIATYAQHDSGEGRRWSAGEMEFSPKDPRRPVAYIAPLSHATYFEAGPHPYFLGIDHLFAGGPAAAELPLVPMGPWAGWRGRWGNTERTVGGRIGNGPRSPGWQGEKWRQPDAWHRRMRRRRLRLLVGRAMHTVGRFTYPRLPEITVAAPAGGRLRIEWRLPGRGSRRGRHLHITLHEDHFVLASRIVEDAPSTGRTTLLVPADRRPTAVMASSYNGLRRRSDVAVAEMPKTP
jgi:hypothetical protein